MVSEVLACERLADHGELRCFLRDGPPPHFAFEVFADADGRAWTLRVAVQYQGVLLRLLREVRAQLADVPEVLDAAGMALLGKERLGGDTELAAILLAEEGLQRFALWQRDRDGDGWSWTLDAVFVPVELAGLLCQQIEAVVARAGQRSHGP